MLGEPLLLVAVAEQSHDNVSGIFFFLECHLTAVPRKHTGHT